MTMPLIEVLRYALLPSAAMSLAGAAAAVRPPGAALRSAILHFAAGVVFSVVAVELLPDVIRGHDPVNAAVGFALGVAGMLLVRRFTQAREPVANDRPSSGGRLSAALLAAVGIDVFIDGLLLGIGFAAGAKEGVLLTLALATELLALGLATATELRRSGAGRATAAGTVSAVSLLLVGGAALGATLLRALPHRAMEVVLSFGLAALLFLVTEELLTEAHEEPETPWLTAAFFAGFLLFMILGMVG